MRPDGVVAAVGRMGLSQFAETGLRPLIVVAHPDDETVGTAGLLLEVRSALVAHLTDGAPADMSDARAAGFITRNGYAAARRRELLRALEIAGLEPADTVELDAVDQESILHAAAFARRIAELIATWRPALVLTHTYEGGHPDHDAAALVTRAALSLTRRAGEPVPSLIEFPSYHRGPEGMRTGRFLPGGMPGIAVQLPEAVQRDKQRMMDCFASQQRVLASFGVTEERYRTAPRHGFDRPPHEGPLHYETLGWSITGELWRRHARAALDELDLDGAGEPH